MSTWSLTRFSPKCQPVCHLLANFKSWRISSLAISKLTAEMKQALAGSWSRSFMNKRNERGQGTNPRVPMLVKTYDPEVPLAAHTLKLWLLEYSLKHCPPLLLYRKPAAYGLIESDLQQYEVHSIQRFWSLSSTNTTAEHSSLQVAAQWAPRKGAGS